MNIPEGTIRDRCTEAVFERGQNYHQDGRIQRIERFDQLVTAIVQGSALYDVTVELDGRAIDTRCTCPYDGPGDCKHVVAVLLALATDPPADESERIDATLDSVSAPDLRTFLRDALATRPKLRDQFLARFGDESKSLEQYREDIEQLFEQHADPTVVAAIDFSRFFDLAEQYRSREKYAAAATVYRAVFEEVDEQFTRIDGAYDHYAQTIQRALDGYVDCVLARDPSPEAFETYAGVLDARASPELALNSEQFRRALDELEDRYDS